MAEFILAKLQPSATSDTGVIDISGTFKAEISGDLQLLRNFGYIKSKGNFDVRLAQKGNQIKGTYGYSKEIIGQLYGDIEGDTIKFHISGPYSGKGVWKVNSGGNEIVGTFFAYAGTYGTGNWNLTKIVAKPAQIPDISGTYISEITGNSQRLPSRKPNPEVRLVQNGNEITGSFESRGKIWGEIEGDTIKFDFLTPGGGTGRGEWTVKPESNEMVGNWFETTRGAGKWNLTKIEDEPAQVVDVSGTYAITELSYPKIKYWKDWYLGVGKNLELTIQKSGSTVTGVFSGDLRGTLNGVIDRNEITFEFWGVSRAGDDNDGEGVLFLSEDSTELIGTFILNTNQFGKVDGKWNFRRIE